MAFITMAKIFPKELVSAVLVSSARSFTAGM